MLRGGLFTREYLLEGIKESDAWKALEDSEVASIRAEVEKRLVSIQRLRKPSEAETESELIWPVLRAIGWANSLPQQNLSFGGRERVPDGLLFGDSDAKDKASAEKGANRFRHGLCIMEASVGTVCWIAATKPIPATPASRPTRCSTISGASMT
jgi:hypothetical protein